MVGWEGQRKKGFLDFSHTCTLVCILLCVWNCTIEECTQKLLYGLDQRNYLGELRKRKEEESERWLNGCRKTKGKENTNVARLYSVSILFYIHADAFAHTHTHVRQNLIIILKAIVCNTRTQKIGHHQTILETRIFLPLPFS